MDTQRSVTDLGLLLIRLMVGIVFVFHGSQKLFGLFEGPGIEGFAGWLTSLGVPLPTVSAWLAGLAEFVGGLAILTGFGLRLLALPVVFTMLVACYAVRDKGFAGGMEFPLTLGFVVAGLGLIGPGRLVLARKGR